MSKTKFTLTELVVPMLDGKKLSFWFDGNGKVTGGNGTFAQPTANSFSLVQVADCPFATDICRNVCYVHKLEAAEREVHDKYRLNSLAIREVLQDSKYILKAVGAFSEWIKSNCPAGFRWHVSGDIFSLSYAYFIDVVCMLTSDVPFWIYTRSFAYLGPLLNRPNLVINLSADADNYEQARALNTKFGLRICYLTLDGKIPDDLPNGSVIFPSHELRGRDLPQPTAAPWWQSLNLRQKKMVCPPDFFGQNEQRRCGPCQKCLR